MTRTDLRDWLEHEIQTRGDGPVTLELTAEWFVPCIVYDNAGNYVRDGFYINSSPQNMDVSYITTNDSNTTVITIDGDLFYGCC